jgi:hypothetical protein
VPSWTHVVAGLALAAFACGCRQQASVPDEQGGAAVPPPGPGRVVQNVPAETSADERYLFYLHGQIVEDQGVRPVHPEFGVYEYEAVLASLARAGFLVISEARGPGTDGEAYAAKVAQQVGALLAGGAPPEQISIVGFSKGGGIAVLVAGLLHNEKVNFVFLGTCVQWIRNWPELDLRGRVLSIYEASDPIAGSCGGVLSASVIEPEFKELRLEVGGGHGAFYRPLSEWRDPVVAWCMGRDIPAGEEP